MYLVRSASGSLLTSGLTAPQKQTPECISDSTSLAANVSRKSVYLPLVRRYVLNFSGLSFRATITPSLTDHRSV